MPQLPEIPLEAIERMAESSPAALVRLVDAGVIGAADIVFGTICLSTMDSPEHEAALVRLLSHTSTGVGVSPDEIDISARSAAEGDDDAHDDVDELLVGQSHQR